MRPQHAPSRHRDDADEPCALPLAAEQKIEHARNLLRAGYVKEAEQTIDDVAARHGDDLDVLLAKAELLSRTKNGDVVTRFLEQAATRPGVQKQLASRPRRAG